MPEKQHIQPCLATAPGPPGPRTAGDSRPKAWLNPSRAMAGAASMAEISRSRSAPGISSSTYRQIRTKSTAGTDISPHCDSRGALVPASCSRCDTRAAAPWPSNLVHSAFIALSSLGPSARRSRPMSSSVIFSPSSRRRSSMSMATTTLARDAV